MKIEDFIQYDTRFVYIACVGNPDSLYLEDGPLYWVAGIVPVDFVEYMRRNGVDPMYFVRLDWFPLVAGSTLELAESALNEFLKPTITATELENYCIAIRSYLLDLQRAYEPDAECSNADPHLDYAFPGDFYQFLNLPINQYEFCRNWGQRKPYYLGYNAVTDEATLTFNHNSVVTFKSRGTDFHFNGLVADLETWRIAQEVEAVKQTFFPEQPALDTVLDWAQVRHIADWVKANNDTKASYHNTEHLLGVGALVQKLLYKGVAHHRVRSDLTHHAWRSAVVAGLVHDFCYHGQRDDKLNIHHSLSKLNELRFWDTFPTLDRIQIETLVWGTLYDFNQPHPLLDDTLEGFLIATVRDADQLYATVSFDAELFNALYDEIGTRFEQTVLEFLERNKDYVTNLRLYTAEGELMHRRSVGKVLEWHDLHHFLLTNEVKSS